MGYLFGKLTEIDAYHLAELMAGLHGKAKVEKARVILYCAAHRMDGKPPYFNVGVAQMARFAGCSTSTARRLLNELEDDGVIVRLGTEVVYGNRSGGEYTRRAFEWYMDGDAASRVPTDRKPAESTGGSARFHGESTIHKKEERKPAQRRDGAGAAPDGGDGQRKLTDEQFDAMMGGDAL